MILKISAKNGFTLLELLVVIAIIGTLMGSLAVAVQRAKQSAHISQCKSHLKQIGTALRTYESFNNIFPPGYTSEPNNPSMGPVDPGFNDAGPGWAWSTYLLPFLEQEPLYKSLNLKLPCWHPANAEGIKAVISIFRCPSDSLGQNPNPENTVNVTDVNNQTLAVFGRSNYVSSVGSSTLWCSWPVTIEPNGAMYRNSRTRIMDFTDGLSNTVFVGERSSNLSDSVWAGVVPNSVHYQWPPFASVGSGGLNTPYDGPGAFVGGHGGPCPYESPVVIHPPNSPFGHSDQMQSLHPGGTNILMGDTSVLFYADSCLLSTWLALVSRNGGEIIHDPNW